LVFANATSVIASKRQLEANEAWGRGDTARAEALTTQNLAALATAAAAAPSAVADGLHRQSGAYDTQAKAFATIAPTSEAGRIKAKAAAEKDNSNLFRSTF
jgi:Ca-activated chloride channel family protein